MFGLEGLIWLGITGAAAIFGYIKTRQFVRRRLRFVDAVNNPLAPLVAGGAAWLITIPVVTLLPIVTGVSAIVFGLGIGAGVLHGAKDVKRLTGG
ncbi:MAG: hypothetical protein ACE5HT_02940 [Gemmatimonadales bacterium]